MQKYFWKNFYVPRSVLDLQNFFFLSSSHGAHSLYKDGN